MSTNKQANRLIHEKSPYLLQHAYNPVNWFPWSDEAFQKAKSEDKPIFLSIGYSTCHWCHVMERESFEHDQVAKYLNEHFISIKVDREERPDVDYIYMQVCQMMTGQGGWPLSIFMNGEKEPFFAGTYFPRESRGGMPGFLDLLKQIQDVWENKRDKINEAAQSILLSLREEENKEDKIEDLPKSLITVTYEQLEDSFEKKYGGFGQQPKFPIPHNLLYLLRSTHQFREKQGQKMVSKTLDSMYRGGIYDHIGYGFSRYSTDSKWLVPHFEKMLYDNALLLIAYTEIYQVTQEEVYKKIANKIITYILRDMVSEEGGFYTAEDADSEGVEGKFYVWDPEKVLSVLGEKRGKEFCRYYDITLKGNFEGKSIPNLIHNPHTIEEIERNKKLAEDRQKLFLDRQKRIHPHKDDKILTAWNGLMIAALSIAGKAFDKVEYMKAAEKCVSFIIDNLVSENRLLARYREGESKHKGYLEDYAFLSWGLLELFQATGNEKYLKMSQKYVHEMIDLFWDEQNGGFYLTGKDAEELLLRPKEIYDGALPSGNSVAAYVMIRLGRLLHDDQLEKKVKDLLMHFYPQISSYPMGYSFYMMAYMQYYFEKRSIILIGDFRSEGYQNLKKKLDTMYLPFTSIRYIHEKNNSTEYKMIQGEPTLYLCENYTCKEPIYGNKQIIDCLDELQLS